MNAKRALQLIAGIALFGLSFSGYLSYVELFVRRGAATCPTIAAPGTLLGQPPCIYGFFMYLAVLVVAALGLRGARRRPPVASVMSGRQAMEPHR